MLETKISLVIIKQVIITRKAMDIGLRCKGIRGSNPTQPWKGKRNKRNFLGKTTSRNARFAKGCTANY